MKMKSFIATLIPVSINGFVCWWIGFASGQRGGTKNPRAFVKLWKDGNSATVHSKTIGDDIKMILGICAHIEDEGYQMYGVIEALEEAIKAGSTKHEVEE